MIEHLQGVITAVGVAIGGLLTIFKLFEQHEKILPREKLSAISKGILSFKFSSGARQVVALWVSVNNWVFGKKIFSWRAMGVSFLLTNLWAGVFIAVFCLLYPQFRQWFFNIIELNSLQWHALAVYVAVLFVDFLSISLTRKVYRVVLSKGKRVFAWGLVFDVVGSVVVYYVGLSLVKLFIYKSSVASFVESLQVWLVPSNLVTLLRVVEDFDVRNFKPSGGGHFSTDIPLQTEVVYAFPEGVFFFTSILTSVWLWGYILAYSVAYACVRLDRFSPILWQSVKLEEQPLSVLSVILGWLWVFVILIVTFLKYLIS